MNHRLPAMLLISIIVLLIPGCDAVVAIFEFGWWLGVIVGAVVVGLVAWLFSKLKR